MNSADNDNVILIAFAQLPLLKLYHNSFILVWIYAKGLKFGEFWWTWWIVFPLRMTSLNSVTCKGCFVVTVLLAMQVMSLKMLVQ